MKGKTNLIAILVVIGIIGVATGMINLSGLSTFSTSGTGILGGTTGDIQTPIKNLVVQAKEKYSNSYTAGSGVVKYFMAGDDPANANANPLDSSTLSSGTVTDSSALVMTSTPYRTIYDGGDTYYSEDFGEHEFAYSNYEIQQGYYRYPTFTIAKVGTIVDMGDETATTGANEPLVCNGQSANTQSTTELYGSADGLEYDISVGDGTVTDCVTISCSGANMECRDLALEFRIDASNGAEGTEISGIATQLKEGKSLNLPSEMVNYWKNQQTVPVGTLKGGESSVYKFIYTITEANLDANDGWILYLDDNGGFAKLDIGQDDAATGDSRAFDAQA